MKVKFDLLFEKLTGYFWAIPTLITVALVMILYFLTSLKFSPGDEVFEKIFIVRASSDGARLILSSIATALMTVVGVLFSIIIVVLQQLSSQYSPRVISNFTRSTMAQGVLGCYIGTFIYCLILLMAIGEKGIGPDAIPQLALAFAVFLAILCLTLLVIYVHFVTRSIQSTEIISRITRETLSSFHHIIKDRNDCHKECSFDEVDFSEEIVIRAKCFGYISSIDWKRLTEKLPGHWELRFHHSPGEFVQQQMELFSIKSTTPIEDKLISKAHEYVDISQMRTNSQDPGYGLQKLVDIALKALSPSVNDPSTAIEAIHSITAILADKVQRPLKDVVMLDNKKRIKFKQRHIQDLISNCYDQIIQFGKDHQPVMDQIQKDLNFVKGLRLA